MASESYTTQVITQKKHRIQQHNVVTQQIYVEATYDNPAKYLKATSHMS